jgi:hypothetical protein
MNITKQLGINLLKKRLANVNKVCYNNPKMSMFEQHQLIKKMNKNLTLTLTKEKTLCQK